MDKCDLYLVLDHYSGAFKIDISKHPQTRLKQISAHYDVGRASIIQTTSFTTRDAARSWESNIHKRYAIYTSPEQGGREWVDLTDQQSKDFVEWMEASTSKRAIKVLSVKASVTKNPDQLMRDRFARGAFAMFISIGLVPGVARAMTENGYATVAIWTGFGAAVGMGAKKQEEQSSSYTLDGKPLNYILKSEYQMMGLWDERISTLEGVKPVGWELPQSTTPDTAAKLYEQGK
ncbi:hypothetical protein KR52_09085 [Synechococcus sp. KORDI-52]|uniref:GIY-YIG nuclease family protein n=1 Tax=Synechococcus sp. KORDI-52 TaxID=585425 RepID=UPI0004E08F1D|nr:GIY-YIG nuclease family protein [Synechococcus sp. KORDI-52]AII49297.1 hypothetical protein KR52_09085 [Synechococcus sp. KORDI-52]